MHKVRKLQMLDYIVGLLALLILIVFWLIVFTFPSFFLFNPLNETDTLRRYELIASTIGWIGISTFAPALLFLYAAGYRRARLFLPIFALLYPTSLLISQITIHLRTGNHYISYLWDFPIFIFTDILLPIFLLFIAHDLREHRVKSLDA